MKAMLTGVVTLLAGAVIVHSQGTVSFGNYISLAPGNYIYVSYNGTRLGGSATGPPATLSNYASETANGDDWTVALYGAGGANQPASSLMQLPGINTLNQEVAVRANLADGTTDGLAGTWYSGLAGALAGYYDGQVATVQVYAWYNEGGMITTYSAAQSIGVPMGFSATANVTLGGPGTWNGPYPPPANLPAGMGNIQLTPEPSTIALGLMGAVGFTLGYSRKQEPPNHI